MYLRLTLHAKDLPSSIQLFAGMPSQTAQPLTTLFANPEYWAGNLSTCAWSTGPCEAPLSGRDTCIVLQCESIQIACPPPGVPPCPRSDPPAQDNYLCARVPALFPSRRFFQHVCNPILLPLPVTTLLTCKAAPLPSGDYECFFSQRLDGESVGTSLELQCTTGSCVYAPPVPVRPTGTTTRWWSGERLTLLAMAFANAFIIGSALLALNCMRERPECSLAACGTHSLSAPLIPLSEPPRTGLARAEEEVLVGESYEEARHSLCAPLIPLSEPPLTGMAHAAEEALPLSPSLPVLSWSGLECLVGRRPPRKVLAGVSGSAEGLLAILGPSGAGKSSLLDILAGRTCASAGVVRLDGATASPASLRRACGYVPQDDVLPPTCTVREHLAFHAALRLSSPAHRRARVRQVLAALGLEPVAGALIGDQLRRSLSGGERRRLSIAVELLAQPAVLLLDEPTSHLDSTSAARVVGLLAEVAARGTTVLLAIHQPRPDVMLLLPSLLVLTGDGRVAFCGPAALAAAHFGAPEGHALCDWVLDALTRATPDETERLVALACGMGAVEVLSPASASPALTRHRPSFLLQLRVLCGRQLRSLARSPMLLWLQYGATLAVALLVGLVFRNAGMDTPGIQARLGVLFFILLFLSLSSLGSLPAWHDNRLLFIRERAAGAYGAVAFFASTVLTDLLLLRVLPPTFFGFITYRMVGLHPCSLCLARFVSTLVLSNISASLFSLAVGIACPSVAVANVAASLFFLASALLSGFLLGNHSLCSTRWGRWASGSSFFNQAFTSLATTELHSNASPFFLTLPVRGRAPDRVRVSGDQVLRALGFGIRPPTFEQSVAALSLLAALAATLALALLLLSTWRPLVSLGSWLVASTRWSPVKRSSRLTRTACAAAEEEVIVCESCEEALPLSPSLPVLSWSGLECLVGRRPPRKVLAGVSGSAEGLLAILGPSGAGKSSLLDILAGRTCASAGVVRLDGATASPASLRRACGYVPQDDVLPPTCTVREHLAFHAALRLSSPAHRRARVRQVLAALGLEPVAGALIGDQLRRSLSGGERRRLSIAVELLAQPAVLLLDEPTSHLDSTSAARVVGLLAEVAARGTTVLLAIHQPRPDVMLLLPSLLVLTGDGRVAFCGPAALAAAHFGAPEGHALCDWVLDALTRATPDETERLVALACGMGAVEVLSPASASPALTRHRPSFLLQLRVLCGRQLRSLARSPMLLWLQYGATLAAALLVGALFRQPGYGTAGIQARLGLLFVLPLYLSFSSLGSLPAWRSSRLLFVGERAAGAYGAAAFFTSTVLLDLLLLRALPPLLLLTTHALAGLHTCSGCAALFFATLALSSVAAGSLCLAVGALAPSNASANAAASAALLLSALFGGLLVQDGDLPLPLRLLCRLSPINRAFGGLVALEFVGRDDAWFLDAVRAAFEECLRAVSDYPHRAARREPHAALPCRRRLPARRGGVLAVRAGRPRGGWQLRSAGRSGRRLAGAGGVGGGKGRETGS